MLADANDAALHAAGADRAAVVWRPVWEGPWFDGDADLQAQLRTAVDLAAAGEPYRTHADLFTPSGVRHLDLTLRSVVPAPSGSGLLLMEGRDRTDERRREDDQRTLLDALPAGVLVHGPHGEVRSTNPAAMRLIDPAPADGPEADPSGASAWIDADGKPLARDRWPAARVLAEGTPVRDVVLGVATHDGTRWLQVDALPHRSPTDAVPHGAVSILHDVTEVRRQARLIEHHTHLDPLTGLPNRRAFLRELERAVGAGESVAVLLVDLDGFRDMNGRHGHQAGDELLRWTARRLERAVRPDDMPARMGGDEFALLLRHVADDAHLDGVAERVQNLVSGSPRLAGHDLTASASFGVARIRPGRAAEGLLHDAGVALGQAKQGGGGRWAVFDPDASERRAHVASFEAELRRATELEQLEVHYQPLVDAKGHEVVGAEALMRWRHPTRGLVPPGDFIPAAEQSGLIVEMEGWLQREAMTQLRRWNRSNPDLHLSMNLSARQLERRNFVSDFAEALHDTGADAANIIAEVTETFAMQHP
ncbi:MAG: diguanylate cyclase, partial [Trueperaceae bacterium]